MTAYRLTDNGTEIAHCDVVGCDAPEAAHFVRHVALAASDHEPIRSGSSVNVDHMGPPLARDSELTVHVFGTAELNSDELSQMRIFIDELFLEQQAQLLRQRQSSGNRYPDYIVHPHSDYAPNREFRRFSCAGFVLEAYREAGIDLIDRSGELPQIELEDLFAVYSDLRRLEGDPRLQERCQAPTRQELGLDGDGPWPVLLPSYIFHALARDAQAIRQSPYTVEEGDQYFPRQP